MSHETRIIRLRTTDALAAGFGTQDENRDFRRAVDEADQAGKETMVLSQSGWPLAMIMPVTRTTQENALARRRAAELNLPRTAVADRLGRLLAQIVRTDRLLAEAVDEFLPAALPGETLAERIERYLRHG